MDSSLILENEYVCLAPLKLENHHLLYEIAFQPKLVQYSPTDIESKDAFKNYVQIALQQQKEGRSIPLIVFDKKTNIYAGCTRYMNINRQHKTLEIGSTWIGKEFQGSGLNGRIKQLMLDYAFAKMDIEKVEFRIDERNIRSRKAVEKLGALLEGILRKNVYMLDGFKRNTCCYGILKKEWLERNR